MKRALIERRPGLWSVGLAAAVLAACVVPARAAVKLPAIFSNHLVLQQKQKDKVWGWATAGEEIRVTVSADESSVGATTRAGDDGKWSVTLPELPAGGPYTMKVEGENTIVLDDVLVGEVWVCSGQSNMQFSLGNVYQADLESLSAHFPQIRLISVPQVGTQEPQDDFKGNWKVCAAETVKDFSAVGYFFGRQLHETLGVPIGLIDDSWGGSAAEAWVRRDVLEKDDRFQGLIDRWKKIEGNMPEQLEKFQKALAAHKEAVAKAKEAGKPAPRTPQSPDGMLRGNARPGNIYNGVLKPTLGYGIKGAIWYQGESNASRAYQYRDLFPLMIKNWRDDWGIGDFPFYWVQLADFKAEKAEPGDSDWAELREAQTMTMDKLPNTGQAVIIDLGEGKDIHPRKKLEVGLRLSRWALAKDYGIDIPCQSPTYKSREVKDNKVTITFDHVGGGLNVFDVHEPRGFTIAGADKKFVNAKARLIGNHQVEVWSDEVSEPVSVRYAWADNPVCNLFSREGLPATPFRTDDWTGSTASNE